MLRIISADQFVTSRWKNGGGLTHEIARSGSAEDWAWRLSIAEVASDGPFSIFEGKSRILTVIEGAGLVLTTATGDLDALPLAPLAFSGELPVSSRMIAGPIRDFNVIYDPDRVTPEVALATESRPLGEGQWGVLALTPGVSIDARGLGKSSFALGAAGRLTLAPEAKALVVRFGS